MLPVGYFSTQKCHVQSAENWPCAFKQLWFHDMPFLLMLNAEAITWTWAIAEDSGHKIRAFLKEQVLNCLLYGRLYGGAGPASAPVDIASSAKLFASFTLRLRQMSRCMVYPTAIVSTPVISLKQKVKSTILSNKQKKFPPASLSSLPAELRLKIFEYATNGVSINVVGYRQGAQDSFYFKNRDNCPIAMTCKKFHEEALEAYFRNLQVNIKAATPSDFSGDMSTFGMASFRDRLKRVRIADWNESRRSKICLAFKNAVIEYDNKYASGARKGAYYFA